MNFVLEIQLGDETIANIEKSEDALGNEIYYAYLKRVQP